MFQANDSALINPFQSLDSTASLPRVNLVRPSEQHLVWVGSRIGLEVFCLVTDITLAIKVPSSSEIAEHQAVWEERMPALNPSWFLNQHMEKCNKTSPRPTTEEEFQFQIRNWFFSPQSGCAGSVCSHSVSSQPARNKNEIQIYVSEFGHKKGMGRHK